ncbi:hypothetical protein D9M72_447100 [compost metagenome]
MRDCADDRKVGDVLRHVEQQRQEHHQRHHRIDQGNAEPFENIGEAHRVFLHTLRRPLDVAQLVPLRHVEIVHGGAPTEHIVVGEERGDDVQRDADETDFKEAQLQRVELSGGNAGLSGKRILQEIEERTTPIVERH